MGHQGLHFLQFLVGEGQIPRLKLFYYLLWVEGSKTKLLLLRGFLVLDVEPLIPPILDGIRHIEVEVVGFWMDTKDDATDIMKRFFGSIASDEEIHRQRPQWG
jgi:hypothetical protein